VEKHPQWVEVCITKNVEALNCGHLLSNNRYWFYAEWSDDEVELSNDAKIKMK
jgi:hypothetical protein